MVLRCGRLARLPPDEERLVLPVSAVRHVQGLPELLTQEDQVHTESVRGETLRYAAGIPRHRSRLGSRILDASGRGITICTWYSTRYSYVCPVCMNLNVVTHLIVCHCVACSLDFEGFLLPFLYLIVR